MPQGSYTCEGDGGERRGRVAASLKGWEPFSYLRGSCTSVGEKNFQLGACDPGPVNSPLRVLF